MVPKYFRILFKAAASSACATELAGLSSTLALAQWSPAAGSLVAERLLCRLILDLKIRDHDKRMPLDRHGSLRCRRVFRTALYTPEDIQLGSP